MDFRRCYGFRAPRPVRESTFMMPQLENFSLFASPFINLNKKILQVIAGPQQGDESRAEQVGIPKSTKIGSRRGKDQSKEEKKSPPKETSESEVDFGIVLNVATLKPEELTITFEEGNEIKVNVKQPHFVLDHPDAVYKRNCSYTYELPDDIDKNSLAALWTSDDYLIILQKDLLRMDLLNKKDDSQELAESSDKNVDPSKEATGSVAIEVKEEKQKAKSGKGKQKISEEVEESPKPDIVFSDKKGMKLVKVDRMLRPGMDIFMLRKYIGDLESYVSTVRKYIENSSFVSANSKTAEMCLRGRAWNATGAYNEDANISSRNKRNRLPRGVSAGEPESGYVTATGTPKDLPETDEESSMESATSTKKSDDKTPTISDESNPSDSR